MLFAPISISTSGDNTIVSGVPGARLRIIRYEFLVNASVATTWKSSIAGALEGPKSFAANGGISTPECPSGILQTAIGEDLVMNINGNVSVGGNLTYQIVYS